MIRHIENFDKPKSIEIGRSAALQHADFIISRSERLKPSMDSFLHIASVQNDAQAKKKFKADAEKAAEKKAEFAKRGSSAEDIETKKISEATELVMLEMMEKFGSLGDDVHASKTNDYDDFFNHIDAYAEVFNETEEDEEEAPLVIGFGFDFTTGSHDATRKIQDNIKRIRMNRQERPHLDYFVSSKIELDEHGNEVPFHAGYMEIVPIVIGLENRHAKELNYLYFMLLRASEDKKRLKTGPEYEAKSKEYLRLREEILSHPIRRSLIEQIAWQIGVYRKILDQKNPLDNEYLQKIDQLDDVVASIIPNLDDVKDDDDWSNDILHKRIREECRAVS